MPFSVKVYLGSENFWNLNLIKLPQDIFNLDFKKIENLEGWGKQSMENLKYSINQRKNISLERLIYSLGIRHISIENAKILSKYFKSFSKFISFSNKQNLDDILNIDGIGETQLNSVNNFFNNEVNLNILEELQKVLIVKDAIDKDKNGLLKEKTFMVTGKLNGISRAEVKSLIEENSGTSVSTVTKKLNYLIKKLMKIAISQPTYLPWQGYFALIDYVDEFIFLENIQFNKRSWQQRNKIIYNYEETFLTIPVKTKGKFTQNICDVEIDNFEKNKLKQIISIKNAYSKCKFFDEYFDIFKKIFNKNHTKLAELNKELIIHICEILDIKTIISNDKNFNLSSKKNDYLKDICLMKGCSDYISTLG